MSDESSHKSKKGMLGIPPPRASARLIWEGRELERPLPLELTRCTEVYPPGTDLSCSTLAGQLILGDNLQVMAALLPSLEGQLDLIYADPPFRTGRSYPARIGRHEDSRRPGEWRLAPGYADTWPDGSAYLNMLYSRLVLMHRLLAPDGTLYLHLDWHAAPYARLLLDEIFGPERILNEIVWLYHGPSPIRSAFKRKHDTILVYTKSERYRFNPDAIRIQYDQATVRTFESSPKAGFGKRPDLARGKVPEDWWYFPVVARIHKERTGYPTQKPEALLERILLASSDPGDLVADFFCGSGTTPAVAERLGRRWLACDSALLAIQTTYRRLLLLPAKHRFDYSAGSGVPQLCDRPPAFALNQEGREVSVQLLEPDSAGHDEDLRVRGHVNSWEIDWDFDGQVFRSLSQAVRPWRSDAMPARLTHTYPATGEHTLCVRAIDERGHSSQALRRLNIET